MCIYIPGYRAWAYAWRAENKAVTCVEIDYLDVLVIAGYILMKSAE